MICSSGNPIQTPPGEYGKHTHPKLCITAKKWNLTSDYGLGWTQTSWYTSNSALVISAWKLTMRENQKNQNWGTSNSKGQVETTGHGHLSWQRRSSSGVTGQKLHLILCRCRTYRIFMRVNMKDTWASNIGEPFTKQTGSTQSPDHRQAPTERINQTAYIQLLLSQFKA